MTGSGPAAPPSEELPAAQGILRDRQHLSVVGANGAGTHWFRGTTALPSAGGVGQSVGSGPHPGSPNAARKNRTAVSGLGRSEERRVGKECRARGSREAW